MAGDRVPFTVLWAGPVGVSRAALLVHWPSDVVGGWLLALGTVPLVHVAIGARSATSAARSA